MNHSLKKNLAILSLFAIAMGLLESAVVIYLRDILYPGGFDFPLNPVRPDLVWTEMLRELSTLVMLLAVGILAGRNTAERFGWFLYSFAVWDIFYYVFLWVLVGQSHKDVSPDIPAGESGLFQGLHSRLKLVIRDLAPCPHLLPGIGRLQAEPDRSESRPNHGTGDFRRDLPSM